MGQKASMFDVVDLGAVKVELSGFFFIDLCEVDYQFLRGNLAGLDISETSQERILA